MGANKKVRVVVCGAGGRMGGMIIHALQKTSGVELTAGVERAGHPLFELGMDRFVGIPGLSGPAVSDLGMVIR